MIFYCIGIDYKKTNLTLREEAYQRRNEITCFFKEHNREAAVLFTCNRIEAYCLAADDVRILKMQGALGRRFGNIFKDAYLKQGLPEVLRHALGLSVGLHSQIIGEPHIASQLIQWVSQEEFPEDIGELWSRVLGHTQPIRFGSGLSSAETTIAEIVLGDIERKVGFKRPKEILIIGTGKIAQLFAKQQPKDTLIYFAARKKHARAKQLAEWAGAHIVLFQEIPQMLSRMDAVVSATASPHAVIKEREIFSAVGQRNRPLYVYDLAVPRDIAQEAVPAKGVVLRDLEAMNELLIKHNRSMRSYCQRAEPLIENAVADIKGVMYEYIYQGGDAVFAACA